MAKMIRQSLLGAVLIAIPMALSAQTAMEQLREQAQILKVDVTSMRDVPAVQGAAVQVSQVQAAIADESLPICGLEERWAMVPWTKRYHVVYGGGHVFRGESVKGFDTLMEGVGFVKTLREHGVCRVDSKREPCRIVNTDSLTGQGTFDVESGGNNAVRGKRMARCESLEKALSVFDTLRAAQLCL